MPMKFKMDMLAALKAKGFTTYRLRKDKLLSESTIQKLRNGYPVAWENIEALCFMLHCQPGDILEFHSQERMSLAGPFTPPHGERCTNECKRRCEVTKADDGGRVPWCAAYGVEIFGRKCDECLRE